jgi:hypothetical protein
MGVARYQYASNTVAFGSITGTFASIRGATSDVVHLVLSNATDAAIDVSIDAVQGGVYGTPNFFITVPAGQIMNIPFGDSNVAATISLDIRHQGSAPTVRNFSAAFIRKRN